NGTPATETPTLSLHDALPISERWIDTRSVRAVALPRLERQRLGRMPVRAHPGDAHAACEVAISKAHPRAAEAARVELLETETRRSEEHTSELQSPCNLVCRLL